MVAVRFVEHAFPEQVIDDVEMSAPPAVGDRVRFPHREKHLSTVAAVEYLIEVRMDRGSSGLDRPTEQLAVSHR